MQTTLENLGELTRRLNVAVPLVDVETEVKKRLARLAKTVKVPGFRPGHVPMKMIAQQYGPQVRSDVISDAVRRSFDEAVRAQQHPRRGLSEDRAARQRRAGERRDRVFRRFEVYPEIGTPDVSALSIERPEVSVEAAETGKPASPLMGPQDNPPSPVHLPSSD